MRRSWSVSTVLAALVVTAAMPAAVADGATAPARHASLAHGTWPGIGTVCENGPGGGASARGVSAHSIDIATFADPANSAEPGLNKEFFQLAGAFGEVVQRCRWH